MKRYGYKEPVTDEQLINLIEMGVQNSTGDFLNSSDLARERLKATYEYAGVPSDHLSPQGVSTIVDTSTTEVIEAYTAILSDLFLNNHKLARFMPYDDSPTAFKSAKDASDIVNYCIFKHNNGWEFMSQWIKAALLWKNSVCRWDYVEDYDYVFEDYEEITQMKLDEILADENVEVVGELEFENRPVKLDPTSNLTSDELELVYVNVRVRKKIDKSKVKLELIPPENFRISRESTCISDAQFVGIQTQMSRSEIRKYYPEVSDDIDFDTMHDTSWLGSAKYSQDVAARKHVTGQEYWQGSAESYEVPLEANINVNVTECWIRVDRDGDGIAELKHIMTIGNHIIYENDVDEIPLANIVPIDIPFEFYGLSMADFTRSSTLANTAILRGFVENTYLTNYAPKLADPNVVDFSALQNMKPKQIIPTNGNPQGSVTTLPPETISTGTVPLLNHLQTIKEQATGMSKTVQGLNDTLYVSGNSEQKFAAVQSAAQKRISHIARRFAETGFKRLIAGVYSTMHKNMKRKISFNMNGAYKTIDMNALPNTMDVEISLDIGENSNSSRLTKLRQIGAEVLPALNKQGAGMVIKPEAPAVLATKIIEAMNLDSNDYLQDYNQPDFRQKAVQALQKQTQAALMARETGLKKAMSDVKLQEANVAYTTAQAKNTMDDNARQLAVAIDKHFQQWAELSVKAQKEGAQIPPHPSYDEILMMASSILGGKNGNSNN